MTFILERDINYLMERQESVGKPTRDSRELSLVRKITSWIGERCNSLNCGLDYWLTTVVFNPSVASFMNEIEILAEQHRAVHQPSRMDKWLERSVDRLMSSEFWVQLENEWSRAEDRRIQRLNQWAREHDKKPIT